MCGIFLGLDGTALEPTLKADLLARGPDFSAETRWDLGGKAVTLFSSVLHMRGSEVTEQPVVKGDLVFQWNGELFAGLPVSTFESDTLTVFAMLAGGVHVADCLREIQGPYAFTLLDLRARTVWFGRDPFGRRSLVYRRDNFCISSLIPASEASDHWTEVLCDRLYSYSFDEDILSSHMRAPPAYLTIDASAGAPMQLPVPEFLGVLRESVRRRLESRDSVAGVLFSGGLDSAVLARLADQVLPPGCSIDLINVAFGKDTADDFLVPDRASGLRAWRELCALSPSRTFNFVSVNVRQKEYDAARERVVHLIRPNDTIMDLSIAIALWFAASGKGLRAPTAHGDPESEHSSQARILLVGSGADEQLGGYTRHRAAWEAGGPDSLVKELQLDLDRIPYRNLGRDDRCISDWGKESRLPFLDEQVVQFLSGLSISQKTDFTLPRGQGDKRLLRLAAKALGLSDAVAFLPKQAIQFGARTAKLEANRRGVDKVA